MGPSVFFMFSSPRMGSSGSHPVPGPAGANGQPGGDGRYVLMHPELLPSLRVLSNPAIVMPRARGCANVKLAVACKGMLIRLKHAW
jgi:hypothetical protein